ncbi:MAG: hypothetical protein JNL62_27360, partial [Bryobacterales bacterium]|nr:hypothetical protein [Bryobacterales bacterium]
MFEPGGQRHTACTPPAFSTNVGYDSRS